MLEHNIETNRTNMLTPKDMVQVWNAKEIQSHEPHLAKER